MVVMAGKPTRALAAHFGLPSRGARRGKDTVFRRFIVLASTALITGVLAGCGNTDSWVEERPAAGWPAQYGDASNSSYAATAGADTLRPGVDAIGQGRAGRRRLRSGRAAIWPSTPRPLGGCSLMVWETDNNARQRWCTRLCAGRRRRPARCSTASTTSTSASPGAMHVVPADPVDPVAQAGDRHADRPHEFSSPGQLLVVTHLGQVLVFDAHRGSGRGHAAGSGRRRRPHRLAARAGRLSAGAGPAARSRPRRRSRRRPGWSCSGCGSPAPTRRFWSACATGPARARCSAGEWTSDAVGGGPLASPVLSADGRRCTSTAATDGCGRWTPPTASRNGLCRWAI